MAPLVECTEGWSPFMGPSCHTWLTFAVPPTSCNLAKIVISPPFSKLAVIVGTPKLRVPSARVVPRLSTEEVYARMEPFESWYATRA